MPESLAANLAAFAVCAALIAVAGTRLTALADRLADRSGIGEAVFGAVFLGGATSLGGLTASITAAVGGQPDVAMSNAIGGIAVQTAFLVVGDFAYRKANLEHAAASVENMMHGALLIALLAIMLLAMHGPQLTVGGVHVLSPVLFCTYALGQRMIYRSRAEPMWRPRVTSLTRVDRREEPVVRDAGLARLALHFAIFAAVVIAAGWLLTHAGVRIGRQTGLSGTVVGAFLIAITTSLPELVTCLAAVRRGALTLAVSDILGGNALDALVVVAADVGYRPGSIYHAVGRQENWIVVLSILMTAVLLLGLLRREKAGFANIGFESAAVLLIYLLGMSALLL